MTKHMRIDSKNQNSNVTTSANPKDFLSSMGIEIDSNTEALLQTKLAAATNGQQAAAIIHADG